jgi:hypothetical protein
MTTHVSLHRLLALASGALAIAICATAIAVPTGHAASGTQTLHFYSVPRLFTFDDKKVAQLPNVRPKPGDQFEIFSDDYAGDHAHHGTDPTASDYLHCVFAHASAPDCEGQAAVGGSMIVFRGMRITGGTGAFLGARGSVSGRSAGAGEDVTVHVMPAH